MSESSESTPPRAVFATTRWTQVRQARGGSPEARSALSDLCAAYYAPVEGFLRLRLGSADAAREAAQEFFARLLAGGGVAGADPARGRFRSYLLGAVKHHLHAEQVRRSAAKRGGGSTPESLEALAEATAGEVPIADPGAETADLVFDRHWAEALLERALERLQREFAAEGRERWFEILKPTLQGTAPIPPHAELAAALDLSEAAVKVAVHRLRKRFRDAVKAEIADTLSDPGQVEEELRHLLDALGGG